MDNGMDATGPIGKQRLHIRPKGIHALAVLREPVHHIGVVGSDTFLIAFTVAENILFGQAVLLAEITHKVYPIVQKVGRYGS